MTGYATEALLLIRLQARAGIWVDTSELAAHLGTTAMHVSQVLDGLSRRGLVRVQRETPTSPVLRAMVEPSTKGSL